MVLYNYVAKHTDTGELVQAEVQAENEQAAARLLIAQKLFPISITSKEEKGKLASLHFGSGVSTKSRIIFTRQLSTLISAGLPLLQSLRTVHDQVSSPKLQDIVNSVTASVEGGSTLAAAFAQYPKVFNPIYISLVQAGETSGSLDKSLERIAAQQDKDSKIISKIRGALIYPTIVLIVTLLVLAFMVSTILPQVVELYKSLQKPLPLTTKIMSSATSIFVHFWWLVLIALAGLAFLGVQYMRSEAGGRFLDGVKLHTPIFGTIFHKLYMARFAQTLGSLLASGVPMLQGLDLVEKAVGNRLVADAVVDASTQVKGGKALSSSLEDKPVFLILVPQMIKIGEQSGGIDQMLDRVAGYYNDEVDEAVATISTTIEPVLMVIMAILIGFVIGSILYPVYSLVGSGISGLH